MKYGPVGDSNTLPFANENVGTIKQRNHFPSKPSVIPGCHNVSPFDSLTPSSQLDASEEGRGQAPLSRVSAGDFRDQADAKWIIIRGLLSGLNDTPCR
jgi:hypothetical protein